MGEGEDRSGIAGTYYGNCSPPRACCHGTYTGTYYGTYTGTYNGTYRGDRCPPPACR